MVNQETPLHKLIIVEDIGRDLNPIGYGFKSPILSPFKAPIDIVRRLLGESMVTNMHEVYEKDSTLRVKLTHHNFRQSFEEIWKEQNPNSVFPWEVGVTDIPTAISGVVGNTDNNESTGYDDEDITPISPETLQSASTETEVTPPAAVTETDSAKEEVSESTTTVKTEDDASVNVTETEVTPPAAVTETDSAKEEVNESTTTVIKVRKPSSFTRR